MHAMAGRLALQPAQTGYSAVDVIVLRDGGTAIYDATKSAKSRSIHLRCMTGLLLRTADNRSQRVFPPAIRDPLDPTLALHLRRLLGIDVCVCPWGAPMKLQAVLGGLVAGLAGVAAMTAAEKLEQTITHRPNSYVPAHTLERLLRLPHKPDSQRRGLNWAMHWGQGILLGATRGLMAERGLRGPTARSSSSICGS